MSRRPAALLSARPRRLLTTTALLSAAIAPTALAAPNQEPVAQAAAVTVVEDTVLTGAVTATDADGDPLRYRLRKGPKRGDVVVNEDGTFTYTPARNATGTDAFTFEAKDKHGAKSRADVAITITPVNDGPTLTVAAITTAEDKAGSSTAAGVDVDGDVLRYRIGTAPSSGTATVDEKTGAIAYTPSANVHASDAFDVEVSDGTLTATARVTVTVNAVNDAPVATASVARVDEDGSVDGTITASDVDTATDGDRLQYLVWQAPGTGSLRLNERSGAFTYTPKKNVHGTDRFSVEVRDAVGEKSRAEVTVTISPVNDAPTISVAAISTAEDTAGSSKAVGGDIDGDALTYRLGKGPASGSATVDEKSGAVVYTPNANAHGSDGFDVEVSDGTVTTTARVTVTVNAVNDSPVATAGEARVDEDGRVDGAIAANDVDSATDGDRLQYLVWQAPSLGTVRVNERSGAFSYVPNKNVHGTDRFSVEVKDQVGAKSRAEVTVVIAPVNDAPTVSLSAIGIAEDTTGKSTAAGSDVDGDTLRFRIAKAPASGSASIDATSGAMVYTPNANVHDNDAFDVEVSDGALSATATVSVSVFAVNDGPVAVAGASRVDEDGSVDGTVVATDVDTATDGDRLQYLMWQAPSLGTVRVNERSGAFTYVPNKNVHGQDRFSVEVRDAVGEKSRAEISVVIAPVNDAPTISVGSITTAEDTAGNGRASGADVDGDTLRYRLAKAPSSGTAVVDEKSGAIVYSPSANVHGSDAFDVEVSDGTLSATARVQVTVTAVNDAPVAMAGEARVDEDGSVDGTIVASDVDTAVDGDRLQYLVWAAPKLGNLRLNERTGAFTFVPNKNVHGSDRFSVEVRDPVGEKSRAEITVTIASVNDAPVLRVNGVTTNEDRPANTTASASDVDGDRLTFSIAQAPAHGSAVIDGTSGRATYTPAPDHTGTDTFTIRVSDGSANVDGTVAVTVQAVSDPPRVAEQRLTSPEDTTLTGRLDGRDPDGDALTFKVTTVPALGRFTLDNASTGAFTWLPLQDRHGQEVIAWEVSDGTTTVPSRLTLVVDPVNDAPTTQALSLSTTEDVAVDGRFVGADIDGDGLRYEVEVPAGATVVQQPEGRFRYTPPADAAKSQTFVVRATDGALRSAPATVTIAITPQNDAPRQKSQSLTTDEDDPATGTLIAVDPDGDPLRYRITKKPVHGQVVLVDETSGRFTYTPNRDIFGDDSFQFDAFDGVLRSGGAVVTVTMVPMDDAPRGTGQTLRVKAGGALTGRFQGYDPEGNPIRFAIAKSPRGGTVKLTDAVIGEFIYQAGRQSGVRDVFTFTVSDGTLVSDPVEVFVDVE